MRARWIRKISWRTSKWSRLGRRLNKWSIWNVYLCVWSRCVMLCVWRWNRCVINMRVIWKLFVRKLSLWTSRWKIYGGAWKRIKWKLRWWNVWLLRLWMNLWCCICDKRILDVFLVCVLLLFLFSSCVSVYRGKFLWWKICISIDVRI